MADAAGPSAEDAAAQRASEQARLRKERREAKIRAGGSSRLNKITGVNGGFQRDFPPPASATQSSTASPAAAPSTSQQGIKHDDDPPSVDISEHFYTPSRRGDAGSQDSLPFNGQNNMDAFNNDLFRQMMLSGAMGPTPPGGGTPGAAGMGLGGGMQDPFAAAAADNPVLKALLEQIGGSENLFAPLKAGQANGAGGPLPQMTTQQPAATESKLVHLWKVAHALFALALGICIAFSTTFSGSKFERERAVLVASQRASGDWASGLDDELDLEAEWIKKTFWIWAAAEAMLLSARFLLFDNAAGAGGVGLGGGMVDGLLGAFLSPGLRGTIRVVMRYLRWILTIRADMAVVIFVLGISSWYRGG